MAETGFTDFGEFSTGSLPGDFTLTETNDGASNDVTVETLSGSLSGKGLKIDNATGGNYRGTVNWSAITSFTDGEVVVLTRVPFQTGTEPPYTAAAGRSTVGAGPAVTLIGAKNGNRFDRVVLAHGAASTNDPLSGFLTSDSGHTQEDEDRFWIRLNFNGTAYKVRFWKEGTSEPGTWDIDTTSATPTTSAGAPGIAFGLTSSVSAAWIEAIGYSDDPSVSAPTEGASGNLPLLQAIGEA